MGEGSTSSTPSGVKSRIPKPSTKSSSKGGLLQSSNTQATKRDGSHGTLFASDASLRAINTGENIADLAQDTLVVVEEFRKQVNKFPNIPKGSKYDHKKRADAFKDAWMSLRKSAGAHCIRPVKKFIEDACRIEMRMNSEDHEVRVESEKLAASARSLEQEVNALNLKIQVLTRKMQISATRNKNSEMKGSS